MSQDEKPIFPRSADLSGEAKEELRKKTKLNLETEEEKIVKPTGMASTESTVICAKCETESSAHVKFCRVCGNNLSAPVPPQPPKLNDFGNIVSPLVEAPPTMKIPKKPTFEQTSEVYGPPPMRLENQRDYEPTQLVYGPPAMNLQNIPIYDDRPVYNPPTIGPENKPSPPEQKTRFLLWLVIGFLAGGLIVAVVSIILILLFFRFR